MSSTRKSRIGRNHPCHCGSGKKYKRCHGVLPSSATRRELPAEVVKDIAKARHKHKAVNARREALQGLGKPIIGTQIQGYQFVGVGSTLHYGKWKTFTEFLDHYLKTALGSEWGNTEISKPLAERHPILQWYDAVCRYQRKTILEPGKIHTAPMSGATGAYYGLAYNLYLLEHNVELQKRLLNRLRHPDQFRGAHYEAFVAACCILSGFELALEDETDSDSTHCEFSAKSKITGKSYSVEAKSRAPNKDHLGVGKQLYEALRKAAAHPRIVFIDVNVPGSVSAEEKWLSEIIPAVKNREEKMKIEDRPAPPAFVIVTNHPYHYDLDGTGTLRAALAIGFKIHDFGATAEFDGLIPAFKAKEKHKDVYGLMEAVGQYHIPSTFDGEIPEFAFGEAERRWTIGNRYELSGLEPGTVGILTSAIVVEPEKAAYLAFQLEDGRNVMMSAPLTDVELAAYRRHPQTFFGMYQKVVKQTKDPLSLFEFFHESYKNTPRERMLEFLKSARDFEQLAKLPSDELMLVFCDRHVGAMMNMSKRQKPSNT